MCKTAHGSGIEKSISASQAVYKSIEKGKTYSGAENKNSIAVLNDDAIGNKNICAAFNSIDILWDELFPGERYRLVHLLIEKNYDFLG